MALVIPFVTPDLIAFVAVFFFVFAIVFALLVKSKLFEQSMGAVAAIAVVIGLATAVYAPVATMIMSILPFAALVLAVLFFVFFIHELFKKSETKDVLPMVICIAVMLVLLNVFWDKIAGAIGFTMLTAESMLWIIGIVLILVIFAAAYQSWGGEAQPVIK